MRIDSASRLISASPEAVYRAFAEPGSMERWLPPSNMTGKMLHFDFREGGSYRMRLTYAEPQQGRGKSSEDSDEVDVRLTKVEAGRGIEQEVTFESEDPAFSGIMRVIWTFRSDGEGTLVTVRAEGVPEGIRPEDHEAGLSSSLENLAGFVEGKALRNEDSDQVMVRMRPLERGDPVRLSAAFSEIGWSKPAETFEGYLREQERGERWVQVAKIEGELAGYVTLVWSASDPVLRNEGTPEIMDLNVLPAYRRRGIGRALMDAAESEASKRSSRVGLRVGLHQGYGAAQRLYVLRGYVPDGMGAVRNGEVVEEGAIGPLDDDLTLRMILDLGSEAAAGTASDGGQRD